jgi:DNA-binding XRE family transcriptional regulator
MENFICLDWQGFVKEAVKRRKEGRITQKQLALLAGVSKPTVVNFEKGDLGISLSNAIKILKASGLAV